MSRQVLTLPDVPPTLLTQPAADPVYANIAGDTFTGPLTVNSATNPAVVVNNSYVRMVGSGYALQAQQPGDFTTRLLIHTSGALWWGSGAGIDGDTILERSATGVLSLTGSLNPNANNFRDLGTTSLRWRKLWAVDLDTSGTALHVGASGTYPLQVRRTTDTNPTFRVNADGTLYWGDGSGIADLQLQAVYSSGAWNFGGHVRPLTANVSDLGLNIMRWRDLHLFRNLQWGPTTAAADTTLSRTGAGALRVDTHLGVEQSVPTVNSNHAALRWGKAGMLTGDKGAAATASVFLSNNIYHDGTNWTTLYTQGGGMLQIDNAGVYNFNQISTTAPGAVATLKNRASINASGTLTLTPDAGATALTLDAEGTIDAGNNLHLRGGAAVSFRIGSTDTVTLYPAAGGLYPVTDNAISCGRSGGRWTTVWAANGTIQTSSVEGKRDITPLDPGACRQAVLGTDWCAFAYLDPVWEPPQGEVTQEQGQAAWDRYLQMLGTTAAARRQNGYVLGSPEHRTHDLFGLADRKSKNNGSDLAIVACALQQALRDIEALKAQLAATGGTPG
jgi:hypothetical protein